MNGVPTPTYSHTHRHSRDEREWEKERRRRRKKIVKWNNIVQSLCLLSSHRFRMSLVWILCKCFAIIVMFIETIYSFFSCWLAFVVVDFVSFFVLFFISSFFVAICPSHLSRFAGRQIFCTNIIRAWFKRISDVPNSADFWRTECSWFLSHFTYEYFYFCITFFSSSCCYFRMKTISKFFTKLFFWKRSFCFRFFNFLFKISGKKMSIHKNSVN